MPSLQKTLEAMSKVTMGLVDLRQDAMCRLSKETARINDLRKQLNAAYVQQEALYKEIDLIDVRIMRSARLTANLTEAMADGLDNIETNPSIVEQLTMYEQCSEMRN